jgi:4-alpha-glucanotransferase
VSKCKLSLLRRSFAIFENNASPAEKEKFAGFCRENVRWLDNFTLFMALREANGFKSWNTWSEDIRKRHPDAVNRWQQELAGEIRFQQYQQYQFFKQWAKLKKYCNDSDIRLIGDIPIFVALDSAEVWANPEMYYLDANEQPTIVAGVPPDYFSKTGQLWGNPLYRWDEMKKDGYRWWLSRFRATGRLVDIIRLDHFRGFEKYWAIPGKDKTAKNGQWLPGPGAEFFEVLRQEFGELPIIAEDLGIITPEVEALRDRFGLPGMRVLQFAFSGDPRKNIHLPHLHVPNCVVYTGTHDNTTTLGWFRGEDIAETTQTIEERKKETQRALAYLGSDGFEINWDFIRLAMISVADTAIIPLQDVLGLGNIARMNIPSVNSGNWAWRFYQGMLTDVITERLKELTYICGR